MQKRASLVPKKNSSKNVAQEGENSQHVINEENEEHEEDEIEQSHVIETEEEPFPENSYFLGAEDIEEYQNANEEI